VVGVFWRGMGGGVGGLNDGDIRKASCDGAFSCNLLVCGAEVGGGGSANCESNLLLYDE
jgi:hypothetical protein